MHLPRRGVPDEGMNERMAARLTRDKQLEAQGAIGSGRGAGQVPGVPGALNDINEANA